VHDDAAITDMLARHCPALPMQFRNTAVCSVGTGMTIEQSPHPDKP
jgi:hypothetical protein